MLYYETSQQTPWPTWNNACVISSNKDLSMFNVRRKQFNGIKFYVVNHEFSSKEEMINQAEYANIICRGDFLIGLYISFFEKKNDAMLFKLRFR